ncbi:MAG TPA: hypothetical protein VJT82_07100 [Pyrinomonadaceae bacterium]|nr:hypothetical protein [Pyrinomonadaceae bacterium]
MLLGVVFGFIGLLLGSPLTAAAMILVKLIYVEDVLGDHVMSGGSEVEGEKRTGDERNA